MAKPSKQLLAEWNKKLSESGFEDAEQSDGNLKKWTSYSFNRYTPEQFKLKENYYQMAGKFIHDNNFPDTVEGRIHKFIWERHSEGVSAREIEVELKNYTVKGNCFKIDTNYGAITRLIKSYAQKMVEMYK